MMLLTLLMATCTLNSCSGSKRRVTFEWETYTGEGDKKIEIQQLPYIDEARNKIQLTPATEGGLRQGKDSIPQYIYQMVVMRMENPKYEIKTAHKSNKRMKRLSTQERNQAALNDSCYKVVKREELEFEGDKRIEGTGWEECVGGVPSFIKEWLGHKNDYAEIHEFAKARWMKYNDGDRTFQKKSNEEDVYFLLTKWREHKCWVIERYSKHTMLQTKNHNGKEVYKIDNPDRIEYAIPFQQGEELLDRAAWKKVDTTFLQGRPIVEILNNITNKWEKFRENAFGYDRVRKEIEEKEQQYRDNNQISQLGQGMKVKIGYNPHRMYRLRPLSWRQMQGLDEWLTNPKYLEYCVRNFPKAQ